MTVASLVAINAAELDGPRAHFEAILRFIDSDDAFSMSHGDLEEALVEQGRELVRRLLQEHLDRRAEQEPRLRVVDAEGSERTRVEQAHRRILNTLVGEVEVTRQAYRALGKPNLHPADGLLNLPPGKHSHGLRRLAAMEAAEGSFESAAAAIERATGQKLGKRQLEALAARAARDFDDFYATRLRTVADPEDVLVISCDGKGIVMRPEGLREQTREAATRASKKLQTRLSKGEKGNRRRMAEVGCVYDLRPVPRTPADVLAGTISRAPARPVPRAKNKWAVASVVEDPATVVEQIFAEAERRDPEHLRTWVALVDGNNHQIDLIQAEARRRGVNPSIVVDFVHVLEYLWKAAWSFFAEGDPEAETWVRQKALAVLQGRSGQVAGSIRRTAAGRDLSPDKRKGADEAAGYLTRKRPFLDYPAALSNGWPIATGVIEGACRHLIKDRMDLTGARWGLAGAEAVLKLRALRANHDFSAYWGFHVSRERRRIHATRYLNELIPDST